MEKVLDVYKRPYNKENPVVCMDEANKQLIRETKKVIKIKPGHDKKIDYEYERKGVYNIFMANEPLKGKRFVEIKEFKTKGDWAKFVKNISDKYYKDAGKITLVMDNLKTHTPGALYEVYEPAEAKRILDRFEFVYTPKHGSWLNMAEIELNVITSQCLKRRIDNMKTVKEEVSAWQKSKNNQNKKINWQFKAEDARIKLKKLYPSIHT